MCSATSGILRAHVLGSLLVAASACTGPGGGAGDDGAADGAADAGGGAIDGAVAQRCPIGDLSADPELEITASLSAAGAEASAADPPLFEGPQGGWLMWFDLRARNLDGCQVTLITSVQDAYDDAILTVEHRPTRLDPVGGWGVPRGLSYLPVVPMCPNAPATRDLQGQPYILHMAIEDVDGRRADAAPLTIVPTCPDDFCLCQCDADYVIGDACP